MTVQRPQAAARLAEGRAALLRRLASGVETTDPQTRVALVDAIERDMNELRDVMRWAVVALERDTDRRAVAEELRRTLGADQP